MVIPNCGPLTTSPFLPTRCLIRSRPIALGSKRFGWRYFPIGNDWIEAIRWTRMAGHAIDSQCLCSFVPDTVLAIGRYSDSHSCQGWRGNEASRRSDHGPPSRFRSSFLRHVGGRCGRPHPSDRGERKYIYRAVKAGKATLLITPTDRKEGECLDCAVHHCFLTVVP